MNLHFISKTAKNSDLKTIPKSQIVKADKLLASSKKDIFISKFRFAGPQEHEINQETLWALLNRNVSLKEIIEALSRDGINIDQKNNDGKTLRELFKKNFQNLPEAGYIIDKFRENGYILRFRLTASDYKAALFTLLFEGLTKKPTVWERIFGLSHNNAAILHGVFRAVLTKDPDFPSTLEKKAMFAVAASQDDKDALSNMLGRVIN